MKISRQILRLVFLFSLVASPLLTAQTISTEEPSTISYESTEKIATDNNHNIKDLVEEHLHELAIKYTAKGYRPAYAIGSIDPYHTKKQCELKPEISINRSPLEQNRITSEIKCKGNVAWKLYVSSEFNLYKEIVVASNSIRRGQVIGFEDIHLKEAVINQGNYSLYHNLSDVAGMVAKRSIRAESTIQSSQLSPPKLVKRGDNVVIVASNNAISVRMNGTALSDGALGQQISVQNLQSKRIVKARVSKAGLVTITL